MTSFHPRSRRPKIMVRCQSPPNLPTQRLRITLRGAVQGVGFRPFVYRLATEMALTGWVLNSSSGLGGRSGRTAEQLTLFERRLEGERPKASVVTVRESAWIPVEGSTLLRDSRQRLRSRENPSTCSRTLRPATIAARNCSIPPTGAFNIPSPTAPTAARATPSWSIFLTIGRTPR